VMFRRLFGRPTLPVHQRHQASRPPVHARDALSGEPDGQDRTWKTSPEFSVLQSDRYGLAHLDVSSCVVRDALNRVVPIGEGGRNPNPQPAVHKMRAWKHDDGPRRRVRDSEVDALDWIVTTGCCDQEYLPSKNCATDRLGDTREQGQRLSSLGKPQSLETRALGRSKETETVLFRKLGETTDLVVRNTRIRKEGGSNETRGG
jgi:hypothetical protein